MTPQEPYGTSIELPSQGLDGYSKVWAAAALPDGVIVTNSDGYVGLLRNGATQPQLFFTGQINKAVAISADGKLAAIGDSSGTISLWELK